MRGFIILVDIAIYVYAAYAIYTIAQKAGSPNPWMAWVPILNAWLIVEISGKEWWWFILFFIPLANIVAIIIVGMALAEKINKPSWMGAVLWVPLLGLITLGLMAWGGDTPAPAPPAA